MNTFIDAILFILGLISVLIGYSSLERTESTVPGLTTEVERMFFRLIIGIGLVFWFALIYRIIHLHV